MTQKPTLPKGTRDFGPIVTAKRNYIFKNIKEVFHLYGYSQIETPALENLSTLMGKYGDEGDKLLFKILNSGNYLQNVMRDEILNEDLKVLTKKISEKGLRYDLTVPFARFVVQNRNELRLPFKRFQIQPVWRADRPQKGRYREFYQCDADVVGSDSLWNEVELLQMEDDVFNKLKINVVIKINNRKILSGIAEITGESDKLTDITVAIDKIDKIGIDNVLKELQERGLDSNSIDTIKPLLELKGDTDEKIKFLRTFLKDSEVGLKGLEEMEFILTACNKLGFKNKIEPDFSLARGLNYYTGTIVEVKALDAEIGSISGGGRYDNLTGIFGLPGISGVGISFGADRIYDVMDQLNLFPEDLSENVKIMFINMGDKEALKASEYLKIIRDKGIRAELYPDNTKMKKQMTFASESKIPFVAIIGEEELNENVITLKDMQASTQSKVEIESLIEKLQDIK